MVRIRELRCTEVSGPASIEASEERQLQMLDIYPELARRGPGGGADRVTGTYVEVVADDGTTGLFGPIFEETAPIILAKLAGHVVGQDPLAYERIWDVLYRQDRHARKGYEMMAISAVDCALWDLRGKLLGLPVYRLLGGPTRERVDCYASMLGNSLDPGLVRARAQAIVEQGYRAQKWFFRYGPSDGLEGMAANVALVRTVREAVGPTIDIMFDCFMGGDATYIIQLLERIAGVCAALARGAGAAGSHRRLCRHQALHAGADRGRRTRVHAVGLSPVAAGRCARRPPGGPRLVRRHHRAGQDLRARIGLRAAGLSARTLHSPGAARDRGAIAWRCVRWPSS